MDQNPDRSAFSAGVKILDWAHLWRVIHKATRAVKPGQKSAQRTWRKQQYEALHPVLWHGNAQAAHIHLESLRSCEQAEPIEAFEDAITSLDSHREWIGDDEQWRQQGFPVGSGMIERGVAVVINPRMKRRGMRWKRCNATAVVALRVLALNTQWDEASARRRTA
jgi:hypothetical protein